MSFLTCLQNIQMESSLPVHHLVGNQHDVQQLEHFLHLVWRCSPLVFEAGYCEKWPFFGVGKQCLPQSLANPDSR